MAYARSLVEAEPPRRRRTSPYAIDRLNFDTGRGDAVYGRSEVPAEVSTQLEDVAFTFGRSYDSYVVLGPRWHYFVAPENAGVIGFSPTWFGFHAIGGLIAAASNKPALLDGFCRFCESHRQRPLIYNVGAEDGPLLRSRGFELTKWGEEPIIDLQSTDWRGKAYEWVRRQENYCLRHGLTSREICVGEDENWQALRQEIEALSNEHIRRTTHGRELDVFMGALGLDRFNRRRLFVASSENRIEAFVVCNPCQGGRRWAFEIYRRAETAPRGTVPFLFMQTMRALKAEGVEEVSLSLIPALNCREQPEGHSQFFARMLQMWWNRFNWLFDLRGIYHFKSRFRPRYEPRYVAALPHFGFLESYAFADILNLFEPNPVALARGISRHLRKRSARGTLAEPE